MSKQQVWSTKRSILEKRVTVLVLWWRVCSSVLAEEPASFFSEIETIHIPAEAISSFLRSFLLSFSPLFYLLPVSLSSPSHYYQCTDVLFHGFPNTNYFDFRPLWPGFKRNRRVRCLISWAFDSFRKAKEEKVSFAVSDPPPFIICDMHNVRQCTQQCYFWFLIHRSFLTQGKESTKRLKEILLKNHPTHNT